MTYVILISLLVRALLHHLFDLENRRGPSASIFRNTINVSWTRGLIGVSESLLPSEEKIRGKRVESGCCQSFCV